MPYPVSTRGRGYQSSKGPLIWSAYHEGNNFNEYTGVSDAGSDLTTTSGSAMNGTNYGMNVRVNDTGSPFAYKTITTSSTGIWFIAFYFDPNSLTMSNLDQFTLIKLLNSGGNNTLVADVIYTSSAYKMFIRPYNDAAGVNDGSQYTLSDAPHKIGIKLFKSTGGNNGYASLYFDNALQGTVSNIDNDTRTANLTYVYLGATGGVDAGTSGNFYIDEVELNATGEAI